MPRYPHYITKGSPGRWPNLVVCVDCVTNLEDVPEDKNARREVLLSWHTEQLAEHKGDYLVMPPIVGNTVEGWWREVRHVADTYHNVLILSYQCGRIWSLLDLWGEMENGRVIICPDGESFKRSFRTAVRDMRRDQDDVLAPVSSGDLYKMLDKHSALFVCEDPPSIAQFSTGDWGNRVLWIDVRNHGVELPPETPQGAIGAAEIASWYLGYQAVLRRYNLGAIKATVGQQAIKGWRHSYYTGGVYVHTHTRATQCETAAYHGGRCEAFQMGNIRCPVVHVDVRSMYPAICSTSHLPTRLHRYYDRFSAVEYGQVSVERGVIASVTIATDEPAYPLTRGEITIWPTGRFRACLAGPELQDAYRHGRIVAWHEACTYDMESCLKEYADALYKARCEAEQNSIRSVADSIKKLLVCLPGKFAQRARYWVHAPGITPVQWWGTWHATDCKGQLIRYRSLGGLVQEDRDMGLGGEAVPAIAAWITSAGRMVLLEAIRLAGYAEVYYCDTDSLIVTELGYDRLVRSGVIFDCQLGSWQVREVITNGHIYGIKHYESNGVIVCAGLPRGSRHASIGEPTYWYTASPSWELQGNRKPSPVARRTSYYRDKPYEHGVVGRDGRVTPHHIEEDV